MPKVSIIDMIAKKLRRCIAIVEDGDTASQAIASGKFVIWKGNPCKASTAISAGATLSNSNLTALSDGIGNELNGKILKYKDLTDTTPMNVNNKSGNTIGTTNFVGCSSQTNGVMAIPYTNSGVQYIKLVNFTDFTAYSGSVTVRVWYI